MGYIMAESFENLLSKTSKAFETEKLGGYTSTSRLRRKIQN